MVQRENCFVFAAIILGLVCGAQGGFWIGDAKRMKLALIRDVNPAVPWSGVSRRVPPMRRPRSVYVVCDAPPPTPARLLVRGTEGTEIRSGPTSPRFH